MIFRDFGQPDTLCYIAIGTVGGAKTWLFPATEILRMDGARKAASKEPPVATVDIAFRNLAESVSAKNIPNRF